MADQTFERVRQMILDELDLKRGDIEGGVVSWFSLKVYFNDGHQGLKMTWLAEETCSSPRADAAYRKTFDNGRS